MKTLFINPRSKRPGEIQQKCFAPLGLLYLAASLKRAGHSAEVIDTNALGIDDDEAAERVRRAAPDIVGIPLLSEIFFQTYALIRRVKAVYPKAAIVLGGIHASALPEEVLSEFKEADYILRGEADESIVRLCGALESGAPFSGVRCLYYRRGGEVVGNEPASPISDLDRLPHPSRELIDSLYKEKRYYMVLVKPRPIDVIITSRGCPFRCRFCCNIAGVYRARSPESVLEEIAAIYSRGIKSLDIADANFTFDRERALRIFELIKKEGFKISFRIKSRADSIDEELVRKARQAGVYLISLGMESGSREILDRMAKDVTLEKNAAACETVMRAGIKLNTGWIIGFPGETRETVRQMADMIVKIRPTTANINVLCPYPGTAVYEEAKRDGSLVGDWSIKNSSIPWIRLPWTTSYKDLENAAQYVKNRVYFRPGYMISFAKEIVGNANMKLAGYALQESIKSLRRA
ncbi:MAG: radical SAM protein [Candidatus Omnitrophica bacterium]|nr:radical SAM protein [Candidatus Omnitrophota bacterium]